MALFVVGLLIGVAFGLIIVGFLAVGAYERGFNEALERRKAWRAELVARQVDQSLLVGDLRKAG